MSSHFPTNLYHNVFVFVFVFLLSVWLTYVCHASSHNDIRCVESEREALLQFKHAIHVDRCGLLDSWGGSQDCCQWRGIHCNNHSGHVTMLNLPGNQVDNYDQRCLQGTLSVSLVELKHLKYLDLSYNYFKGQNIPKFIGSLPNLRHLNLARNGFQGMIPNEIGNLSRLTYLELNCQDENAALGVKTLSWLSQLRLLTVVDLGGVDLSSVATNWLSIVNNLPDLRVLSLDNCGLSLNLPASLSYMNSSTSLRLVSLEDNNLNDLSIFEWLFNLTGLDTSFVYLDLSSNDQMFGNNFGLIQRVMNFLGNLCSLQTLLLTETNLSYDFSDIVQALSVCASKSLVTLNLGWNGVWGSIPEKIETFSSLTQLLLTNNQLNGTLTPVLGQLSMLEALGLGSNSLKGVVSTGLLSNLTGLRVLDLSDNAELVVDIDDWNPPQLNVLDLSSCKIGPRFPKWLITQTSLYELSIHYAGISDTISESLSKSLFWPGLEFLDMSHNMIYGVLPDVPATVFETPPFIDLSYNDLEGAVPLFLRNVSVLNLENNKLSEGLVPFLCPKTTMQLSSLDLSNNLFSAKLPDCWRFFDQLSILHLENNTLWGNLPTSIGRLDNLEFVHLRNNNLSGKLPTSLVNCTSLVTLDLAYNSLTGYIPPAFGHNLKNLGVLNLGSNHFSGALPSSLCLLSKLQILDVSTNNISGNIPRCVYKLTGMANPGDRLQNISVGRVHDVQGRTSDNAWIMWKGQEHTFEGSNSLPPLKGIDMSGNKLVGRIPDEISSLIGLVYLNLSGNSLSGAIPSRIGQMTSVEFLDLSHNNLSGEIPSSLAQIDDLEMLDVSYNNLSGMIPVGTQLQGFNTSSYMGNPGLCGAPLPKCHGDDAPTIPQNGHNSTPQRHQHSDDDDIYPGLYISVVLGFIVGFWGVCGTLVLKRSWRIALFRYYDDIKGKVVGVNTGRAGRRS